MDSAVCVEKRHDVPAVGFAIVRGVVPACAYQRSHVLALGFAVITVLINLGLGYLTYTAQSVFWLVFWAVARGLSVGPIFIVAHDACHDSLSPSSKLNYLLGQICFLPSWHSFTAWKVRHNHIHHRHTNIIELDTGYPPASVSQYAAWPWWKRLRYRLARTPAGAALLYFPEALHAQLFPPAALRKHYRAVDPRHSREWLLVWSWIAAEVALFSGLLAHASIVDRSPNSNWLLFGAGFLLSHYVWNWQMGFTTFLHHFHPTVGWYTRANAPASAQRQLESTVHVDLGGAAHLSMLNIFMHTAHHVDTRIPLYRLPAAQKALERQFGDRVSRWPFSIANAFNCFRECKLWDPERRRWTRFS